MPTSGALQRLIMLEVRRAFTTPSFQLAVAVGCLVAAADAAVFSSESARTLDRFALYGSSKDCGLTAVSCFVGWVGASHGAFARLFFVLLPLLAALPYCCSRISDERSGMLSQVRLRAGSARPELAKAVAVFLTSGLAAAIPLASNFALLACLNPAAVPQMRDLITLQSGVTTDVVGHGLFYTWPAAFLVLWVTIDFLLMGLWGTSVLAATRIFKNRVLLVVGAYLFQMSLAYLTGDFAEALGRTRISIDLFVLAYPVGDGAVATPCALFVAVLLMTCLTLSLFICPRRGDFL